MNNIIISDTSCLIALTNIGHLEILKELYSKVSITEQVKNEFGSELPPWIIIQKIKTARNTLRSAGI
jgi:predicted nucleic acid-binding protein